MFWLDFRKRNEWGTFFLLTWSNCHNLWSAFSFSKVIYTLLWCYYSTPFAIVFEYFFERFDVWCLPGTRSFTPSFSSFIDELSRSQFATSVHTAFFKLCFWAIALVFPLSFVHAFSLLLQWASSYVVLILFCSIFPFIRLRQQ